MDTLFKRVTAVTMDAQDGGVVKDAFVGVSGGKIGYIGQEAPKEPAGQVIDGAMKVLIPGLINAHTHIPMAFLRGYADDSPLQEWLYEHVFPAEAKLTDEAVLICARAGIAEAISFGTTSVSDMYSHLDSIFEAAYGSGIKYSGSNGSIYFGQESDFGFETCADTVNMREMHMKWHGADGGRLLFNASIHAEYTSSYPLWEAVAEYAVNNDLRVHTHLSETKKEHDDCVKKYGLTPAQLLDCHGLWLNGGTAAHCVWLEPEDMSLLAKRGVSAAHNPVSNQKLGSGTADVAMMLSRGMNAALGTDGVSSNNNLDLFEEMKAACLLAKNKERDPAALSALEALKMATLRGAEAQGRQSECGKIAPGYDADLVLVDFDKPHLTPCHSVISGLVYAARGSDVVMTMVRGKTLYKNGEFLTIDWEKTKYDLSQVVMPLVFS